MLQSLPTALTGAGGETMRWYFGAIGWLWATSALAQPAADGGKPPALLEPYAGYDLVFSPQGEPVLGPDAAPSIERMFGKRLGNCDVGDIDLQPQTLAVKLSCEGIAQTWTLRTKKAAADRGPVAAATDRFVIQAPTTPCDGACLAARPAIEAALVAQVTAGEQQIPWQRVRAKGTAQGESFESALQRCQALVATGDRPAAVEALNQALRLRDLGKCDAESLFDIALLAHEAHDQRHFDEARRRLDVALAAQAQPTQNGFVRNAEVLSGIAVAAAALAGDPTTTVDKAKSCLKTDHCDVLWSVRALAAMENFAQAGELLDLGPLRTDKTVPRREFLKLRFGLATAMADASTVQAVAQRMIALWPDDPEGYDVLSTGYARAGQLRKAIETLHEIAQKHPERDIVLGRIAGLLNFLGDEAQTDPKRKLDMEAIENRMQLAAADPKDLVARFVVATRLYYAGKLAEALPKLTELAGSTSRDPRIPLYIAMDHFWLGHQEDAQKWIQKAVDIGPSDPDVFYCRSQIVRRVNLPLAIADLERYETMTTRPWSVGPKRKAERVAAELAFMKRGEIPPDWDKPGPERAVFDPAHQPGVPVAEDVRRGAHWLPGAVTPTELPVVVTAAGLPAELSMVKGEKPSTPSPESSPWLPVVLVVAVAGSLGLRLWQRKGGK